MGARLGNATRSKFRSWAKTTECDAWCAQSLLDFTRQTLGAFELNGATEVLPIGFPWPDVKWSAGISLRNIEVCEWEGTPVMFLYDKTPRLVARQAG